MLTTTLVLEVLPVMARVPPLTVVPPRYWLLPLSVSVPEPVFTRLR